MMTSEREERQPLLREGRDESADCVAEPQGPISRGNVRNLLVANGIVVLVTMAGLLHSLALTQYVYARLASRVFGSNFSSPAT